MLGINYGWHKQQQTMLGINNNKLCLA